MRFPVTGPEPETVGVGAACGPLGIWALTFQEKPFQIVGFWGTFGLKNDLIALLVAIAREWELSDP